MGLLHLATSGRKHSGHDGEDEHAICHDQGSADILPVGRKNAVAYVWCSYTEWHTEHAFTVAMARERVVHRRTGKAQGSCWRSPALGKFA